MRELRAGIQKRAQDERQTRIREEEDEVVIEGANINCAT